MKNLSTAKEPLSLIYLDANATTPVLPQAAAAALSTMDTLFGNPSSSHVTGIQAKQIMDQTRKRAQRIIGSGNGDVIFTSGATEGIQTAILSALNHAKKSLDSNKNYTLLYGATEHKAVPESLKHWNEILEINAEIKAIPVDSLGKLDIEFIAREVPNALMICTMAVNNETGVYQDINLLDSTIRTNNPDVYWMVDSVQALGKTKLNLATTSIDYAPFSGHKLYAPKGIGFVYIKENSPFTPFIAGGGQESGLRSGTENLPGMAALNVIFSMLENEQDTTFSSVAKLHSFREKIASSLTKAFPNIVFNHSFKNSVPTTINFAIPGFASKEIMDLFDAANIRVSSGSACSSKVTRSFVLDAMGLPVWQSEAAIRMSFGPAITEEEVNLACERIEQTAKALVQSCLTLDTNITSKTELEGLQQFKVGGACSWLYIDRKTKSAVFIDPLEELNERLTTLLACQDIELTAIIDTHGHADHESCRTAMAKVHLKDEKSDNLGWPKNSKSTEINGTTFQYIALGDKWLIRTETPGHTDDSISLLLCEPLTGNAKLKVHYAFCGDLILMDSLGRTNFSTSSASAMYNSLQSLFSLTGEDCLICPSHDYNNEFVTNINAEKSRNPLLANVLNDEISVQQFATEKAKLDQDIIDESGCEIMCGALLGSCQSFTVSEYDEQSLEQALTISPAMKLIDIRESYEYSLQHKEQFDSNIPLTRLVEFISENQNNKHDKVVFICRSGSRSHMAANALARLGFDNVGHLKGGYALN